MQRPGSSLARMVSLAAIPLAIAACGSEDKPWWQRGDACPDGASVEQRGNETFCVKDGKRHGRFESLSIDGKARLLTGSYVDGLRHGTFTQFASDGRVLGTYELDGGSGAVTLWREDGSVASVAEHQGDVMHGAWTAYHPGASDAPVAESGRYEDGKPAGTWKLTDTAGQLVREIDYRGGILWVTRYFENGTVARTELSEAAAAEAARLAAAEKAEKEATMRESLGGTGILGALMSDQNGLATLRGPAISNVLGKGGSGIGGIGSRGVGGVASGGIGGGGRVDEGGRATLGAVNVSGALDKAIIRRYLRRKRLRVQACYNKELAKKPTLAGTVKSRFVITAAGSVGAVSSRGLGNKAVESCISRALKSVRYPKPQSGGIVNVSVSFKLTPKKR